MENRVCEQAMTFEEITQCFCQTEIEVRVLFGLFSKDVIDRLDKALNSKRAGRSFVDLRSYLSYALFGKVFFVACFDMCPFRYSWPVCDIQKDTHTKSFVDS